MTKRALRFVRKSGAYSAFVVLAALTGCGGDARVAAVHGIVTLDGKPVGEASVTFMPKAGGRPAFGITNADGTYALTTFKTGDGAVVGNHVVTIAAVDEEVNSKAEALGEEFGSLSEVMQSNQTPKQIWRIPPLYSDSDLSGLEFDVKRGAENQADFSLMSKP